MNLRIIFSAGIAILLLATSCANPPARVSLTAEQASALARQLANERAFATYHCRPFRDDEPARFVSGHWVWTEREGLGHLDIQVTVKLAKDGSGPQVDLKLFDSQSISAR